MIISLAASFVVGSGGTSTVPQQPQTVEGDNLLTEPSPAEASPTEESGAGESNGAAPTAESGGEPSSDSAAEN
jgi:hypothetical protein